MYRDFGTTFMFGIIAVVFLAVALVLQRILSPKRKTPEKLSSYECGEDVEGLAWVQFNIRFYIVALIFIIFEVEVVFLFPWAVVYGKLGLFAFVEMMIFIFVLAVGLAYVWRKGDLEWVKYRVLYGRGRYRNLTSERTFSTPNDQALAQNPSGGGEEVPTA